MLCKAFDTLYLLCTYIHVALARFTAGLWVGIGMGLRLGLGSETILDIMVVDIQSYDAAITKAQLMNTQQLATTHPL